MTSRKPNRKAKPAAPAPPATDSFRLPQLCAVIAAGIALLALAGWQMNARFLAGQWDSYIPMAPSTALAFLLLGGALFSCARWPGQRVSRNFALTALSLAALLGLLVLGQLITGIDLGLEQALSRTNELLGRAPLGRMSPLTAISFLLESAALFILLIGQGWPHAPTAAVLHAIVATAINLVVLLGYAYGAPLLYGGPIVPTAFPTAVAFAVVGIGLIGMTARDAPALRAWSRASLRGRLLRAFLPPLLLLLLIEGWLEARLEPLLQINLALWHSLRTLVVGALIVAVTGWIGRRTADAIEQAQAALRRSEALLKETQEITKVGGWEYDVESGRTIWTDEVYRIYGLPKDEYDPSDIPQDIQFYAPHDQARIAEAFRRAAETGEPYDLELEFRNARGVDLWVRTVGHTERREGKVGRVFGNIMDITERKRAEEALRESEERFRRALENIPDVVVIYDRDLRIQYINDATRRITGRPTSDFIGRREEEIWPPEVYEVYLPTLQEAFRTRTIRSLETNLLLPDGASRALRITCVPLIDEKGEIREVLGITHDYTERVQAEERIHKLNRIYSVLSDINQAIVRVREPQALFERACRIAVEKGNFRMAWIGLVNEATRKVEVAVHAGVSDGYLEKLDIVLSDEPRGRGPTATALRSGQHVIVNNIEQDPRMAPWRDDALRLGYRASAAFPLQFNGKTRGTFNLYATEPNFFDTDELKLLDELALDLSFAMEFAEKEEERKQAEEALAASEEELRAVFASMIDVVLVLDREGVYRKIAPTNPDNLYKPPDQLLGKSLADVFPEEQARFFLNTLRRVLDTGQTDQIEYELASDDRVLWFEASIAPMTADSTLWVARDVSERKQRERELEAIAAISAALRAAETRAQMLPIILDKLLDILSADATALVMRDPATGEPVIELGRGDWSAATGVRLPPGQLVSGRVIQTGQPYLNNEVRTELDLVRPDLMANVRAMASVPLIAHQLKIGALEMGRKTIIRPEEVRLLTSIADIAANAIHRAALHEQTERQLQRLTALRAIDAAISASLDLRITLNVLLDQLMSQLNVDAAAVLLLNPTLQRLAFAAGRGFKTKGPELSELRLGEGYAGRAALERKTVSVRSLPEAPGFTRAKLFAGENVVAYFAVPLISKGVVSGVLEVFHRSPMTPHPDWLDFLETLAGQAAIAVENASLFTSLQKSNVELALAYDATIAGWSRALDLRDRETEGHTQRVAEMAERLAKAMGIGEAELVHIRRGALLHDIGKMGVPDSILHKPGKLTDDEWTVMRLHPQLAYDMLAPIAHLRSALDIPYCHHEKWDGTGYPRGLKGEEIPLAARIFAVVDVWDALRSDRPYRAAWPEDEAREYICQQASRHFDPKVMEAFLKVASDG